VPAPPADVSRRLRDAIAADLEAREGVEWFLSTGYNESGDRTKDWGFDVTARGRTVSLWFDEASASLHLSLPSTFIRRRGLSMAWTDLSDENEVQKQVRSVLNQHLPG
jgi:hypothetical protein